MTENVSNLKSEKREGKLTNIVHVDGKNYTYIKSHE